MSNNLPSCAIKSEDVITSGTDLVETDVRQIITMATGLRCTVHACEYNTTSQVPDATDLASKLQLLQIHTTGVHNAGGGQVCMPGSKAKIDALKIQLGVDQQTWDQLMTRWMIY